MVAAAAAGAAATTAPATGRATLGDVPETAITAAAQRQRQRPFKPTLTSLPPPPPPPSPHSPKGQLDPHGGAFKSSPHAPRRNSDQLDDPHHDAASDPAATNLAAAGPSTRATSPDSALLTAASIAEPALAEVNHLAEVDAPRTKTGSDHENILESEVGRAGKADGTTGKPMPTFGAQNEGKGKDATETSLTLTLTRDVGKGDGATGATMTRVEDERKNESGRETETMPTRHAQAFGKDEQRRPGQPGRRGARAGATRAARKTWQSGVMEEDLERNGALAGGRRVDYCLQVTGKWRSGRREGSVGDKRGIWRGGGRGGAYSFVACLSHLTIDHASLSRRSTVPTPIRHTSNI